MVKVYNNGKSFLDENKVFLDLNKYMATFFYLDSSVLYESTKDNYALKCEDEGNKLLGIKVEPYNLILYGSTKCLKELIKYLVDNGFVFGSVLCPSDIGCELLEISKEVIGKEYYEEIGMDFMEAKDFTLESSKDVLTATKSDLDEIYEMTKQFFLDCGLNDEVTKEKIEMKLDNFRIIRDDGKIASMAAFSRDLEESYRITHVFTRDEYRNKGYARKVV
ncbi:MAG: hypothetical protein J5666_05340, partial [Bacilli bacterium]|nr:hypothetical protein [Bacilli bacterium]